MRLALATRYLRGDVDAATACDVLRRRDRALWLEMESSTLAGILIEPLLEACPDKRFVLTIRDVYSWFDSWIDQNINGPPQPTSPWAILDRVRLRVDDFEPTRHDEPLTVRGFPPLACYFQLWASHNARVLAAVPPDRLLVVETRNLTPSIPDIAAWAGVGADTLRADRGRLNVATERHHVLASIDPAHVRETADRLCGELMAEYFPDVVPPP